MTKLKPHLTKIGKKIVDEFGNDCINYRIAIDQDGKTYFCDLTFRFKARNWAFGQLEDGSLIGEGKVLQKGEPVQILAARYRRGPWTPSHGPRKGKKVERHNIFIDRVDQIRRQPQPVDTRDWSIFE
jgi:hypothetical protein